MLILRHGLKRRGSRWRPAPRVGPGVGVILGSGLGAFAGTVAGDTVPFSSIRGLPKPTVFGHAGLFKVGKRVAVMAGRIHYYEGHSMDDVVLPVFLLARLGVRTLIVTNAAGGVNRSFSPGSLSSSRTTSTSRE